MSVICCLANPAALCQHWQGPYVSMGKADAWPAADSVIPYLFDPDQKSGTGCEDPTMFRGKNGSLHMLLHKYQNGAPPGWPGLHAFSADG